MSTRSYLSIGDVLTLLRQEFPDVTISKIRFLESQGLVNPERTPSGYRKFYEQDVERLRWVLRQQREHFLPLKVIKDRLDDDPDDGFRIWPPASSRTHRPADPTRPRSAELHRPAPVGGSCTTIWSTRRPLVRPTPRPDLSPRARGERRPATSG